MSTQPNEQPSANEPIDPAVSSNYSAPADYTYPAPPAAAPQAGPLMAPSEERTWAILVHLSPFLLSILGPVIVYAIYNNRGPFISHHAKEALNFQITLLVASIISAVLTLLLVGFVMLLAIAIGALVLQIMAALAASRGEWYRYPMTWRVVS